MRTSRPVLAAALAVALAGCATPFGPAYEYEETLTLDLDGSALVVINASTPALEALRGLVVDAADRDTVRRAFESAGCRVDRVGRPWRRDGRRFVQVRVEAGDVRELAGCGPLAWSRYEGLAPEGDGGTLRYRQTIGSAAAGAPAGVRWTGREIVAFRLVLPSRILHHNVRRLEDGEPGEPGRGNILAWEQRLADRLAGVPIEIDVRLDPVSILHRTLWLFLGAVAAAVATLAGAAWWVARRGRRRRPA